MWRGPVIAFVSAAILFAVTASAQVKLQEMNVIGSAGESLTNWHGASRFASGRLEFLSRSSLIDRHLSNGQLVTAVTFSKVQQPHSWFGPMDGEDNIRAFAFYAGVRKNWRTDSGVGTYLEIGTGPMWSNRRIPAATSQVNFESQLGAGVVVRAMRTPLYLGYRFSHVSNGGIVHRNPGLQVNAIVVGWRAKRLGDGRR